MIIKNAAVYTANFSPSFTDVEIENGVIKNLNKTDAEGIDFSGCVILPGFIDIHIHGCNMADATDGNADSAAVFNNLSEGFASVRKLNIINMYTENLALEYILCAECLFEKIHYFSAFLHIMKLIEI